MYLRYANNEMDVDEFECGRSPSRKWVGRVTRETRGHNDKAPQKTRSSYIRFGKRANPNADLLYLDQLIL
ncbi:hypothetical protein ANCCEY_15384 [Ancylostoma ceylanicum]|uniref:Uncharacterized protein n=1 Tax=Ancylostoma ceylanicum TaxID=53326 RepID=A0A0D6LCS7_9BILA|nr:hypothetical protein ANCCEY_15384 [Ancylostoma ceylanicum]